MYLESEWFVVNLLYKSVHSSDQKATDDHESLEDEIVEVFEERHFLIKAKNQESAELIGNRLGYKNELSYENIYKETVHWQFVELLDCFEVIDELEEGAEIYSRHIICPQGTTADEMIERYFPDE